LIMKSLFGIILCILLVLICTSCEKYESLDVEYHDIFGTWELVEYFGGGEFGYVVTDIDQLTIVRSDEKKLIGKFPNKMSKFANYQSYFKGELFASGEVVIADQYDDVVWISFTNDAFYGSGRIAISSLNANEMVLNRNHPSYYRIAYSFIKVPSTSD